MTQAGTDQTNSPSQSTSDDIKLDLFAFPCGHGDTILLHLSDGTRHKWVLVDCYLPAQGGARKQFFGFLRERGVERLDVIFQTHPDRDHFHGMPEVLNYFTTDGRSVGVYCDCGVDAKLIREWNAKAKPKGTRTGRTTRAENEYVRLKHLLSELKRAKKLRWKQIDAERPPVPIRGFDGSVVFVPAAPDPEHALLWDMVDVRKVIFSSSARPLTNRMSIVLVLSACFEDCQFTVLLGADSDRENIDRGLTRWQGYARENGLSEKFDVVKVPHHGSVKSHSARLPECKPSTRDGAAVFSVGRRRVLPDREVLRAYLDAGWTALSTTTRYRRDSRVSPETPPQNHPMMLADRSSKSRRVPYAWRRHLVRVTCSCSPYTVDAGPADAIIAQSSLPAYETAIE